MDRIPTFRGHANGPGETAGPQHQGTIHLNSESTSMVDKAFADACQGFASDRLDKWRFLSYFHDFGTF